MILVYIPVAMFIFILIWVLFIEPSKTDNFMD